MFKKLKNNKGMTLVEVIVAWTILVLIVCGFSYFFMQSILYARRAQSDTLGVSSARALSDNSLANLAKAELETDLSGIGLNTDKAVTVDDLGLRSIKIKWRGGGPGRETDVEREVVAITVPGDGGAPSSTEGIAGGYSQDTVYHVFVKP